jgi:transcriptional regulator with XRE-family HTH domain
MQEVGSVWSLIAGHVASTLPRPSGLTASAPSDAFPTLRFMDPSRIDEPFVDAVPKILREREMSLRALARQVGVGDDHLSRVLRGAREKKPTAELVRRTARALNLPEDYFMEARLDFAVQALSDDAALLNQVYDLVKSSAKRRKRTARRAGTS